MEKKSILEPLQLISNDSLTNNVHNHYHYSELKELKSGIKKLTDYDALEENNVQFNDDCIENIDGLRWNESDSSVTLVNQNLWQIPPRLTVQYASMIRKLDLSYNCLQTLSGIEFFNCLEELILDNNLLNDSIRFFYNPMMKILSINKNKLTDLERFLNEITLKLPGLTFLSMLGNAACPDQLSSSDHDDKDYSRYRSYVIHRMPQLKFLDSGPIRNYEREDAQKRGHYYRLIRLNSDSVVETNRIRNYLFSLRDDENFADIQRQVTPLPNSDNSAPKGGFGRLKHRYTGKHSEGNRFIRNHEL